MDAITLYKIIREDIEVSKTRERQLMLDLFQESFEEPVEIDDDHMGAEKCLNF